MRLIAALVLGSFLSLVGVQSAHAHDSAAAPADSCAVCALAHQAQRQAPSAAPAVITVRTAVRVVLPADAYAGVRLPARAAARAPPRAS